jgi:2-dehydro-3-deoxyphosphooctonate aldolase (KDO 8-P synthase)
MFDGFPKGQLFLIAGPCVLEDDELNLRVAEALLRVASIFPGGVVFKASFDKANRSNPDAPRGPGLEQGLERLALVRERSGLPVLTDVHLPDQCATAAGVADVLQIPAFLCRQTDLLRAAGATGRPVNIKKGQWMQPEAMTGAVAKVLAGRHEVAGAASLAPFSSERSPVAVTERGTFFGYGDLVVDMRSIGRMRSATDAAVIFDATHSVQQPGRGPGGASGGTREHIATLLLAAVAAGADGIFLETHPDPDRAPSDGPNMLPLSDLPALMQRARAVWEASRS